MMLRTQLSLDPELHRRAKKRAGELGISLAEYVRRLIAGDLDRPRAIRDASVIFDLGRSGHSDISVRHDDHLGEVLHEEHVREGDDLPG